YIWESDGTPFEYIFCLDDIHILEIPSEKILIDEFGYKSASIMGANPLANSRLAKVLDKYGSVDNFRKEIEKNYVNDVSYTPKEPNIWWVNQGQTMEAEKDEGILWAPIQSKGGKTQYHWETMTEVKAGDIILHYANGALRYLSQVKEEAIKADKPASMEDDEWNRKGRLIKTEYYKLDPAVSLDQFNQELVELEIEKGPINKLGGVNQGYLFYFTKEALAIIQNSSKETNWPDFSILEEEEMIAEPNNLTIKEKINQIKKYIKSQGFTYPDNLIENFYLSLKTKPFVLLAGISGTGKTKLVQLFAEAIGCSSSNKRFKLISVKPDWNDSADLLGYSNIRGDFQPGPILETIKKADDDPDNPYLVCLDEMNLARVEYYFSDFLSKMETRYFEENRIKTDEIFSENEFDDRDSTDALAKYGDLYLPDNLYIIGTVNMDETTHPFSKKVLDRANTIEFNQIELTAFLEENYENIRTENLSLSNDFLKTDYLKLKDMLPIKKDRIIEITEELNDLNQILKKANLQVGYRIRDEINFYIIEALDKDLLDKNTAFDKEILQKVLPRIQGSSMSIKNLLIELFYFFTDKDYSTENGKIADQMERYYKTNKDLIKYPESSEKTAYMLRRYEEDGFTSYWL
ncbi:MAG: McrB family protein, partial [bacterium]